MKLLAGEYLYTFGTKVELFETLSGWSASGKIVSVTRVPSILRHLPVRVSSRRNNISWFVKSDSENRSVRITSVLIRNSIAHSLLNAVCLPLAAERYFRIILIKGRFGKPHLAVNETLNENTYHYQVLAASGR